MSQVITKQFDGTRKAIFTMNFKIASTTAESFTIVPSALNNSKGFATGATANSGDVCTNLTINKIWWSVNNTAVTKPLLVEWKATANSQAITCNYADSKDFSVSSTPSLSSFVESLEKLLSACSRLSTTGNNS